MFVKKQVPVGERGWGSRGRFRPWGRNPTRKLAQPAHQWRGQAVHILLPDDRLGDTGTVELEVQHGQGARYQYNVQVPNVVVTRAATDGMEVRIGPTREGQAVQVYSMQAVLELSNSTVVPWSIMVAEIARCEGTLNLMPGIAVGNWTHTHTHTQNREAGVAVHPLGCLT